MSAKIITGLAQIRETADANVPEQFAAIRRIAASENRSARLTTSEIREMVRSWPVTRLHFHINGARETMRSVGTVIVCARHIAIMRAELARRDALA